MANVEWFSARGWAAEDAPFRPGIGCANAVVIGIEQGMPAVRYLWAELPCCQQKGAEKPCRMGQMPFGWAGKGRSLNHVIFRRQAGAEGQGLLPAGRERLRQPLVPAIPGWGCRGVGWQVQWLFPLAAVVILGEKVTRSGRP